MSDLHLGGEAESGERGFRLCTHEPQLSAFIRSLSALDAAPSVELVINGDFVDFLAEAAYARPPAWSAFHYPESVAIESLDRIAARSAEVFDALRAFLAKGHRLVVLPGNHDSELNLPAVRRRLRKHIGADSGGDYEFVGYGEAYRVGDVLIEHGDRLDDMNRVDHTALRHLGALVSRSMPVGKDSEFDPPPGSKLVANVINNIKKRYAFIDLLKPEVEAAFPLILALEPGRRDDLLVVAKALAESKRRRYQPQIRFGASNIGARSEGTDEAGTSYAAHDELDQVLLDTIGRVLFPTVPAERSGSPDIAEPIAARSFFRSFWSLLTGEKDETWESRLVDLFDALRAFERTNSFLRSEEPDSPYYKEATRLSSGTVRHVIFGHTHFAKAAVLKNGALYFNTGTWADILELPRDILDTTRTFLPLAELEQLVRDLMANDFSRHVAFRPTYVRIEQNAAGLSIAQELCDYTEGSIP